MGVSHLHPLDFLCGVGYIWQLKFAAWHQQAALWNRLRQLLTDKAAAMWVTAKHEAMFRQPLEADLVHYGLASKGVTNCSPQG